MNSLRVCVSTTALIAMLAASLAGAEGESRTTPGGEPEKSAAAGKPIRVLIYSGQNNHDWRKTTPEIERILRQRPNTHVEVTEHPEKMTAKALGGADVIVSNWNNFGAPELKWSDSLRKAFLDFVRSGKGHVTVHAGGSSFNDWEDYHRIAAYWAKDTGHGPRHEFSVKPTSEAHAITKGISPFDARDELWHRPGIPAESTVLMTAFSAREKRGSGKDEPVLTVNRFGMGRCVNFLLGHDALSMRNPGFEKLLLRSVEWAATGSVKGPPKQAALPKVRIFVESDLPGGDPDDEASMTRFFLYLNELDVEGIVGTRKTSQSRTRKDGKATILEFIDAYEEVHDTLRKHDPAYPTPKHLRSIARQCHTGTEARDLLIRVVDKEDPRPVVISNWGTNEGNKSSARQTLDHVKETRSEAEYRAFAGKIILCEGGGQKACYQLQDHYKSFYRVIDTFQPDRWYHRWRPITAKAGGFDMERDVKTGHGPVGALYTIQKEGDTPCFLHCLPTGLVQIDQPTFGSWAGRFGWDEGANKHMANVEDSWQGSTSRDNTLKRWAVHIQNDFAARADWCVKSFSDANHPPVPVVNGDKTLNIITIQKTPGETIRLSAAGSSDPDSDSLSYEWVYYPEPGTCRGKVDIAGARSPEASLQIPEGSKGATIHVVLMATDDGEPALTRYRRIVITSE